MEIYRSVMIKQDYLFKMSKYLNIIPGAHGDMGICQDYAHPILMSPQILKATGAPVHHLSFNFVVKINA